MNFKPGDRVRCVEATVYPGLTLGQVGTVKWTNGTYLTLKEDPRAGEYYIQRFVLAESNEERDIRLARSDKAQLAQITRDLKELRALERDEKRDTQPDYRAAFLAYFEKAEHQLRLAYTALATAEHNMRAARGAIKRMK